MVPHPIPLKYVVSSTPGFLPSRQTTRQWKSQDNTPGLSSPPCTFEWKPLPRGSLGPKSFSTVPLILSQRPSSLTRSPRSAMPCGGMLPGRTRKSNSKGTSSSGQTVTRRRKSSPISDSRFTRPSCPPTPKWRPSNVRFMAPFLISSITESVSLPPASIPRECPPLTAPWISNNSS